MDPIYKISEASGCVRYVGVTCQLLEERLADHLSEAKSSKKRNHRLNWLSSQDQPPTIEVIEWVLPGDRAEREKYWIALFRDYGHKLVNGTDGGDGAGAGSAHPNFGKRWKHSAEARAKISAACAGEKNHAFGKKQSPELIEKRAAANRGKKRSPEYCAATGARQRGEKHPAFGKKQSPELIEKRAASNRGGKRSLETRARMSVAALNREQRKNAV